MIFLWQSKLYQVLCLNTECRVTTNIRGLSNTAVSAYAYFVSYAPPCYVILSYYITGSVASGIRSLALDDCPSSLNAKGY